MEITKELLEEKKSALLLEQERLLGEANCVNGAIQNIDYWLDVLDRTEPNVPKESESAPSAEKLPPPLQLVTSAENKRAEEDEVVSFTKDQFMQAIKSAGDNS
jgi:hypothetical protein